MENAAISFMSEKPLYLHRYYHCSAIYAFLDLKKAIHSQQTILCDYMI